MTAQRTSSFPPAELPNHLGQLSKTQRRAVRSLRRSRMGRAIVDAAVLSGTIYAVGRIHNIQLPYVYARLGALVLLSGLLLATVGRAYVLWHVIESDLANGHVREREGYFLGQRGSRATFNIWQRRTQLTVYEAHDFERKTLYRLYTLPRSGILVSAEARYDKR
jgi:hypothetical protein